VQITHCDSNSPSKYEIIKQATAIDISDMTEPITTSTYVGLSSELYVCKKNFVVLLAALFSNHYQPL